MADISPEDQETTRPGYRFATNLERDDLNYLRVVYEVLEDLHYDIFFEGGARDMGGRPLPNHERVLARDINFHKIIKLIQIFDDSPEGQMLFGVTRRDPEVIERVLFSGRIHIDLAPISPGWIGNNRSFLESCLKTAYLRRASRAQQEGLMEETRRNREHGVQLEEPELTREAIASRVRSKIEEIVREHPELSPST